MELSTKFTLGGIVQADTRGREVNDIFEVTMLLWIPHLSSSVNLTNG
jgi:hypothetical protein